MRYSKGDLPIALYYVHTQITNLKKSVKMYPSQKAPYKQDNLRLNRKSIPGATYAIVKNTRDLNRPIIPDPYQRAWKAAEYRIITESIAWLTDLERWRPIACVVLPDHMHIVFELGDKVPLGTLMASFVKYTTRQINILNGWEGPFWQAYYYDRRVRSYREFCNQVNYVRRNPVKQGYVREFEDWPYGWCAEEYRRSEIADYG